MRKFFEKLRFSNIPPKYRTIFIISIVVAVFIIFGAVVAMRYSSKNTKTSKSPKTSNQLSKSLLDGKDYPSDLANRHPLAVSIENYPAARPQSGLDKAPIIYEAMTEGGITRFLAIYSPKNADEIGPIRSARLFFMDWIKEYDAFFAHDGGNEDALANMDKYQIKDMPVSTTYYWRDRSRNVASEHTLYSSTVKLYDYAKSKNYNINSSDYTAMKFKVDGPPNGADQEVVVDFSSASYKVTWTYDKAQNIYLRLIAGSPHKDKKSGEQLRANNIIIQTVSRTLQPHGSYSSENWVFQTTGSGDAVVIRDGKSIKATWKKANLDSRTKFYDETGAEIQFNPGNTWYEIVAPESKVSY